MSNGKQMLIDALNELDVDWDEVRLPNGMSYIEVVPEKKSDGIFARFYFDEGLRSSTFTLTTEE